MKKNEKISKRYDLLSRIYSHLDSFPLLSRKEYYWRRYLVDRILPDPHDWMLEVGAGPGIMLKEAVKIRDSVKVIGIDISKKMMEKAKEEVKNSECMVSDACRLPFKSDSIGSVIYAFTLTTLPDFKCSLEESMRVLKDGGFIGIIDGKTPHHGLRMVLFAMINSVSIAVGGTHFDRDIIAYINGIESVKKVFYTSFYLDMSYVMILKVTKQ